MLFYCFVHAGGKLQTTLLRKDTLIFQDKEGINMENKNYNCADCANRRTPLCNLCRHIKKPSGSVSKPTMYVGMRLEINADRSIRAKNLATLIEGYIRSGMTIPTAVVLEYNKLTEG